MRRPSVAVPVPVETIERLIPASFALRLPVEELVRMAVEEAARSYEAAGRARRPIVPLRAPTGTKGRGTRQAPPAGRRRPSRLISSPS